LVHDRVLRRNRPATTGLGFPPRPSRIGQGTAEVKERRPEIHFYEWSVTRWACSNTRDVLDATGRGIYRELLDRCYIQGPIPSDTKSLSSIARCTTSQLDLVWPLIKHHFKPVRRHPELVMNEQAARYRREVFLVFSRRQAANRSNVGKRKYLASRAEAAT
jgi:hypothetical protein